MVLHHIGYTRAMPFASFVAASLALNLVPGPDMTYVAARALAQGRRAGIISALGIGVGCFFHIGAAALGITVLLQTVPQAYAVVRIVGAAYLIYLGIGLIRRAGRGAAAANPDKTSEWAIFRQGVITNVLNPKVALFFLAFLPQFVDPASGPVGLQTLALGVFFDVQGTTVNIIVACVAAAAGRALDSVRQRGWMERISGVILVALGVRLALARPS
jgi:threonine/homoserine/homoserine lactone efflux protein